MTALYESFKRRLLPYEEKEDFCMATILDPRFKLNWCSGDVYQQCKSLLIVKAKKEDRTGGTCTTEEQERPKKKCRCDDLLDMFFEADDCKPSTSSHVEEEVDKYLSGPKLERHKDPLLFWQVSESTFPNLASLACKYLPIPASSAAVERLFSIGGKIFRPERCRLSDKVFEQLMFIRCNGHLLSSI